MLYRDFYPFYAAQGNPDIYNEEREQEKEFDLMKSYYPDTARRIQEKAEAQCQLLDYEGSRLYDEYPDRFMLYHICSQVKDEMASDASAQEIPGNFRPHPEYLPLSPAEAEFRIILWERPSDY